MTAKAGTVSVASSSSWPFPLPKGRSENRVSHIRYEVVNEPNRSVLKAFNDPADGTYSVSIGFTAFDAGKEYGSAYTDEQFTGETCDFDAVLVAEMTRCVARFADVSKKYARIQDPKPGEPVVTFPEEIWRYARDRGLEYADSLLEIAANSYRADPEIFLQAVNQLEQDVGVAGLMRQITVEPRTREQKVVLQSAETGPET
ncbi:hypothetical protein AB4Y73_01680 [Pseudarthrobacter sp. TAF60_1]